MLLSGKVTIQTDLQLLENIGGYISKIRLITLGDSDVGLRGNSANQRYVHYMLPDYKKVDRLLVVEVYTNEGCTSLYRRHKHDNATDIETYYHRFNPSRRFCQPRIYTDDKAVVRIP